VRRRTIDEIAQIVDVSRDTFHVTLGEDLNMRRVYVFVGTLFHEISQRIRVKNAPSLAGTGDSDPAPVTGDEMYCCLFDPESKQNPGFV
jgi:hypothetical protein